MKNLRTITDSYCQYLEQIDSDQLASLDQFVAHNIVFKDPFHQTIGIDNFRAILNTMFLKFSKTEFKTKKKFFNFDNSENTASFCWSLKMRHLKTAKIIKIDGMSFIEIDPKGLIIRHEDYWDPTSNVYQLIPLVGSILRMINKTITTKFR